MTQKAERRHNCGRVRHKDGTEIVQKDPKRYVTEANPLNTHSKILLIGMLAVVFCYVGAFFTPLGVVQQYLNTLPAAAPVSLAVAILALIYIADGKDGAKKPVLDIGREMSRLPWNTIIFLGA